LAAKPDILIRNFRLCAQDNIHLSGWQAPEGWRPDATLPLEQALPLPWDEIYRDEFGQNFQPSKLWSNAVALCDALRRHGLDDPRAGQIRDIIAALIDRMRSHTINVGRLSFIDNRFRFTTYSIDLPQGWVSGIGNAFAILACCEINRLLPEFALLRDIRRYADAFFSICVEGHEPPERWISFVDRNGYLWFEEYPMPGGRANLVLNGHVYATLALFRALAVWPDPAYAELVRAGATTAEAYGLHFLREGAAPLYALRGTARPDYLPERCVRQQYQLFNLTGSKHFLDCARLLRKDMATAFDDRQSDYFDILEKSAIANRNRVQQVAARFPSTGLKVSHLREWRLPDPLPEGD
jgi:hypothetical protein